MPLTLDEAIGRTEKLYAKISQRRGRVRLVEDYYRGRQRLRFASDKFREYHADRYRDFCDNWCAPVANSPAERLRIDGFRLDEDPEVSDTEKSLWRDWQANDMEAQSSQGFLHSIIAARSFVLVWGDDEDTPVATWERADQVAVGYDVERPGKRVAALKTWCQDGLEYATLYLDDQVWKLERPETYSNTGPSQLTPGMQGYEFFQRDSNEPQGSGLILPAPENSGWRPRAVRDEPNPMPNPLGVVPIVEFANRPMLGADPLSHIAGTISMQDAINLLWAYLFNAADFASMPSRVVLGQEAPKIPVLDESGQKIGEMPADLKKLAEDRILWLNGQNTKIGQWDAAKLEVFTQTIETCVTHVAAQTRTPPHYLILGKGMVNVNAEGMKAAEAGLVALVGEEQTFFAPPAREVFRLFALVRNQKAVAEQARFGTVKWKDAENRSEAQLVDALQKLGALGFPFQFLAEKLGLSQTEIQRLLKMRESEAAASPSGRLAGMLADQRPGAVDDGAGQPAAA